MSEVILALENLQTQIRTLKDHVSVMMDLQREKDELTQNMITLLNEGLAEHEERLNNLEKKEDK